MLIFKDKTIKGQSDYNSGFKETISETKPWEPKSIRHFYIKTKGIESLYLQYTPEYVIFDVALKAEDPVGYTFDKDVAEYDLLNSWKTLKNESDRNLSESSSKLRVNVSTNNIDTVTSNSPAEDETPVEYLVISDRAYFYNMPDSTTRRNAYLIKGQRINSLRDTDGYMYCEFQNLSLKKRVKGWLKKEDVQTN